MAKKINENELNNVSGGCGGDDKHCYWKLYAFDSNNTQIGSPIESEHFCSETGGDQILKKALKDIFHSNPNISYIKYDYYDKNGKGSNHICYRENYAKFL